jgi:hypothetical protein
MATQAGIIIAATNAAYQVVRDIARPQPGHKQVLVKSLAGKKLVGKKLVGKKLVGKKLVGKKLVGKIQEEGARMSRKAGPEIADLIV